MPVFGFLGVPLDQITILEFSCEVHEHLVRNIEFLNGVEELWERMG